MTAQYEWKGSLFDCLDDGETCLYGYYCAACLFGQNAEKIDRSNCCFMSFLYYSLSCCWLCWIPHNFKRGILRQKYGLPEDPNCPDCPATFFCGACAICQEARFLKHIEQGNSYAVHIAGSNPTPVVIQPHARH